MQIPVRNARITICRIFPFRNGSTIFCGIIDKIKSKIFCISPELFDEICPLKSKLSTGKNISLIITDEITVKSKIHKNLLKTFAVKLCKADTFSIAQMLDTIEIKIKGIVTAIIAPNNLHVKNVIILRSEYIFTVIHKSLQGILLSVSFLEVGHEPDTVPEA